MVEKTERELRIDELSQKVAELMRHDTGETLTEVGIGILAVGLFRSIGEVGHVRAASRASTASDILSDICTDFLRQGVDKRV